jgi:hypothetical protein
MRPEERNEMMSLLPWIVATAILIVALSSYSDNKQAERSQERVCYDNPADITCQPNYQRQP